MGALGFLFMGGDEALVELQSSNLNLGAAIRYQYLPGQAIVWRMLLALALLLVLLPRPAFAQRANYQFVATFATDEKLQGQLERLKQLAGRKPCDPLVTPYHQLPH